MSTKFAELEVKVDGGDVVISQFTFAQDEDDVIAFPPHQAAAICKAIMAAAKEAKGE